MALTLEVARQLDAGRVQIDAKGKLLGQDVVRHYDVPKEKADEFIANYKKEVPRNRALAAGSVGVSTLLFGLAGAATAKKSILLKAISSLAFAGIGLLGSAYSATSSLKHIDKAFLERHDAHPMFILKTEGPSFKKEQMNK